MPSSMLGAFAPLLGPPAIDVEQLPSNESFEAHISTMLAGELDDMDKDLDRLIGRSQPDVVISALRGFKELVASRRSAITSPERAGADAVRDARRRRRDLTDRRGARRVLAGDGE